MTDVLNGFSPQRGRSGYCSFRAERISSSLVLVSIRGAEVDFIGTDGLSVLLAMERRVEQLDVGWVYDSLAAAFGSLRILRS